MGIMPSIDTAWSASVVREAAWRDPVAVAAAFADEPHALLLLSDGGPRGRWSYLLRQPIRVVETTGGDPFAAAAALLGPGVPTDPDGPPFQGGVAGLFVYEAGLSREPSVGAGRTDWPDLAAGLYPAVLAFDHVQRRVLAVGRGRDAVEAERRAVEALSALDAPDAPTLTNRLAESFAPAAPPDRYEDAVSEVVRRIEAGEIFQANVAQAWSGRLAGAARPFDLLRRLAGDSPAPFAGYLRLPGRAVVSNSPERFVSLTAEGVAESRPIKGTRPRGADPAEDAALAAELMASAKDRAENLMIVDLMRNDLARVCRPGSVEAAELYRLETYANVHHMVSVVRGRLAAGAGPFDLLGASFPPGSITGAPKVQAMRVIAGLEPPRGPYCGSLFWAGFDGAMDSSVLIRTASFTEDAAGWSFEARAGAGLVADSDPAEEEAETRAKIAALASGFGWAP